MDNISPELLQDFFSKQGRIFTTNNGLTIGQMDNGVYSSYKFSYEEIGYDFELFTEVDNLHEFIDHYRLNKLEDIKEFGYREIWIRYLNTEAEMQVTQADMEEGPLTFRLHKHKTMIYSRELHFYDEVNKHLTLAEDFIEYFFDNEKKVQVALKNMYRY